MSEINQERVQLLKLLAESINIAESYANSKEAVYYGAVALDRHAKQCRELFERLGGGNG